MKFFLLFVAATIAIVLIARFKPKSPAEPIIPTESKEAQGTPGTPGAHDPPARTEEQGREAARQGGSTYYVAPAAAQRLATGC